MRTPEDIIKEVLEMYEGSQINLDSFAARDLIAKHIAAELEADDFWANLDQGQCYNIKQTDYVDDDLAI